MADLRTLTLALVADVDKFKKGLDKADNETKGFSTKLKKALKVGAAAFAALGTAAAGFAIKIGKDAVNAASDFSEELSKSEVVLGDAAKAVQQFARNAQKIGQSRTEALRAASNFAIFGKSAGLSGKALANFSTEFTTLASDLASFNNTTPEDAILALGAALRGESEPIRRYGVLLDDATLKQRALSEGIIDQIKGALTPQQKVLAATAEIFAQTSDAQGDFERTSDGLANTQRELKVAIENVKIELGESLLPIALDIANKMKKDVLPVFETFIKTLVGGPNALDASSYFAYKAQENLGEKMDDNEWAGYHLAMAIRELGSAFGELFTGVEEGTGEGSGFAQFVQDLTDIINKIADTIRAIDRFIEKTKEVNAFLSRVPGLGGFGESQAVLEQARDVTNKRRAKEEAKYTPIQINFNNLVSDPQRDARTINKIVTKATSLTGLTFEQRAALR